MTTMHVTAERGRKRWVLQSVEHPGAISEVTRLDQAEPVIREAIAFVAGVPEDSFDVAIQPVIPATAEQLRDQMEQLQAQADQMRSDAARLRRQLAAALAEATLTTRDIGVVLGVSHQRAAQLVSEAEPVRQSA